MSSIPLAGKGRNGPEMTNRILTVREYADRINGRRTGAGSAFSRNRIADSHHKCLLGTFKESLPAPLEVLTKSGRKERSFVSQGDMNANT